MGIPATGKGVQYQGFAIDRIVDGKREEHSRLGDFLGVAEQIGAVLLPRKEER
jgi:predicted ester cyclase